MDECECKEINEDSDDESGEVVESGSKNAENSGVDVSMDKHRRRGQSASEKRKCTLQQSLPSAQAAAEGKEHSSTHRGSRSTTPRSGTEREHAQTPVAITAAQRQSK